MVTWRRDVRRSFPPERNLSVLLKQTLQGGEFIYQGTIDASSTRIERWKQSLPASLSNCRDKFAVAARSTNRREFVRFTNRGIGRKSVTFLHQQLRTVIFNCLRIQREILRIGYFCLRIPRTLHFAVSGTWLLSFSSFSFLFPFAFRLLLIHLSLSFSFYLSSVPFFLFHHLSTCLSFPRSSSFFFHRSFSVCHLLSLKNTRAKHSNSGSCLKHEVSTGL